MKTGGSSSNAIFALLLLFFLFGCAKQWYPTSMIDEVRKQDLGGFPYHPLVYHLDLSILAYQLYGQTLVWPFDPYYEEANNGGGKRTQLMDKVRSWARIKGTEQVQREMGLDGYRGPGVLNGFDDNPAHDPILYRYDRLHPWSPNITNAIGSWIEYLVPAEITGQIREVYMCYRRSGESSDSVAIEKVLMKRSDHAQEARDILLAFEGGTGDKGIEGQPASQSLMGFVLVRHHVGNDNFDVHIVFRGSRSGSAARAALQALNDDDAKGNPDWITDLGYNLVGPASSAGPITLTGSVSRGMTSCMKSVFPTLFQCLMRVAELSPDIAPERIFITGHSLGGGLAQLFASSVLLGDRYGPEGNGFAMMGALRLWPWKQLKLITFSAPRVGDDVWAEKLTREGLSSDFFSTVIDPYDRNALKVADTSILPVMTDPDRPSGFRVLIPSDPITTEKIPGGKHVGKTVYVSKPGVLKPFAPPDLKAHEPANVRAFLYSGLDDSRIPATAWQTRVMTNLNPDRDKSKRGTPEEYQKLASSVERYYRDRDIYFDASGFKSDFDLFLEIYNTD